MVTTIDTAHPTARKEHICQHCGCKIQPGQRYYRQTNIYEGRIYDFITHEECSEVASELDMYYYCDDGLDGDTFREEISQYVYDNHYDDEADDIESDWANLNYYEQAKKILKELREEKPINK